MEEEGRSADLAEEPWVEPGQFGWHVLLVHVVELVERSSGREAALHQVQHGHHPYGDTQLVKRGAFILKELKLTQCDSTACFL